MDFRSFGKSLQLSSRVLKGRLVQISTWCFLMKIYGPTGGGVIGEDGVSCREFATKVVRGTSAQTPADLQCYADFPSA